MRDEAFRRCSDAPEQHRNDSGTPRGDNDLG